MSAFVISLSIQDQGGGVIHHSYWKKTDNSGKTGYWVNERKHATRFFWSWAHEVKDTLKRQHQEHLVQVESAPDADMDWM